MREKPNAALFTLQDGFDVADTAPKKTNSHCLSMVSQPNDKSWFSPLAVSINMLKHRNIRNRMLLTKTVGILFSFKIIKSIESFLLLRRH